MLCLLLMPAGIGMAQSFDDTVAGLIRERLEGAVLTSELSVGSCRISSLSVIPELYRRRDYRAAWGNIQAVEQLTRAIEETYDDGLDPNDYHADEIRQIQALERSGKSPDPMLAASRDIILTDALVRLAFHTSCGKEDPVTHHPQWNLAMKIGDTDPVELIEKAIQSDSLARTIGSWRISHPYYDRMKAALAEHRAIRARGGWGTVPEGPALKKGMIDPRVVPLRMRLAVTDNLAGPASDPMTFDTALEQAVIHFQRRHWLRQDGAVGKGTLAALNVPVEDRIDQIRVNLERARWIIRDLEDAFVLVDIAGFRVFYSREGRIVWSSRAQVGQPYRDTPVFRSVIEYVEFNPTWTVPPGIFKKDVLPAVIKDPGYLKKKGLIVVDNHGRVINSKAIRWSRYENSPFPYNLRQDPGEDNALGRVRIFFPNKYLVYLHDTPHKELFEQEERAFSSGCIRLEKPIELSEILLDDPRKWNRTAIEETIRTGRTKIVPVPRPVSILLLYWTVEVGESGTVYFKKDPYNRDPSVLEGLGRDAQIRTGGAPDPGSGGSGGPRQETGIQQ